MGAAPRVGPDIRHAARVWEDRENRHFPPNRPGTLHRRTVSFRRFRHPPQIPHPDRRSGSDLNPRLFLAIFTAMNTSTIQPTDIVSQWQQASAKFQGMSAEEKREIFVSAGILTKNGNVTKRYKDVIVPVTAKTASKGK